MFLLKPGVEVDAGRALAVDQVKALLREGNGLPPDLLMYDQG
jgi:hypothetical protein